MNSPVKTSTNFRSRIEEFVCWSRMQAEAGQTLETIVSRKEHERLAGNGIFLWGVGNAPAVAASDLARARMPVRVVFSIMKSRPKAIDAAPDRTVVWRRYIDLYGAERMLPPHTLVTSRADSGTGPKKAHYALMCYSEEPLTLRRGTESFDPSAFRNAGGKGSPVGHSQVTALLRRVHLPATVSDYEVNLSAWLVDAYWVRLTDPVLVTASHRRVIAQAAKTRDEEWMELVTAAREGPSYGSAPRSSKMGSLI